MPEIPLLPDKKPKIARLDEILAPPDAENFTEATIRYEAPETRRAREASETATAAHERLLTLLKLGFAGILLTVFVSVGIYVLLLKSNTTEAQRMYVSTVITAIASGSTGYAFGKKHDKPDKE